MLRPRKITGYYDFEILSTSSLWDSMIRDRMLRWKRECFVSDGEMYTFRSIEGHLPLAECEITAEHRTFSGQKHCLSGQIYICTEKVYG